MARKDKDNSVNIGEESTGSKLVTALIVMVIAVSYTHLTLPTNSLV